MRIFNEYRTTNNSYVFKKLYKRKHAHCEYCKWHGPNSENDRWDWYYIYKDEYQAKYPKLRKSKYPNWKLVSKNKKQWMKKRLIFKEGRISFNIEWKTKNT